MRVIALVIAYFFAYEVAALADDLKLSRGHEICLNKANGDRSAISKCYDNEFPVQDARLNAAYKRIFADADASQRAALRDAQRDWIKARDSSCFLTNKLYHNSWMKFISEPWCRTEETARRAGFLEDMTLAEN